MEVDLNDLVATGTICASCKCYFYYSGEKYSHKFPVLCYDCYDKMNEEQRDGKTRAIVSTKLGGCCA